MKYKDTNYTHLCISLDAATMTWIDQISQINGRALTLWLRAMLFILNNDNRMSVAELTRQLCGHNVSKQEVINLLAQSQCFEYDEAQEYISCTEQTLDRFLIPTGPQEIPTGPQKIPTGVAHAGTLPTVGNNKINKSKKRELTLSKRKSIAELCSSAPDPAEQNFYQNFLTHYPRICQMEQPLSYQEYQRILSDGIPIALIRDVLNDMENHRQLHSKYVSANLTLRKWIKIRMAKGV